MLLCDSRFREQRNLGGLSLWLRPSVQKFEHFGAAAPRPLTLTHHSTFTLNPHPHPHPNPHHSPFTLTLAPTLILTAGPGTKALQDFYKTTRPPPRPRPPPPPSGRDLSASSSHAGIGAESDSMWMPGDPTAAARRTV